ncbi:hypothetical protein [Kocuria sp. CH-021]|uniref:hypothetical protein n=1 Tax=Kocuria sp. CH-021 TaxID=3406735 RepID=UPI003C76684A
MWAMLPVVFVTLVNGVLFTAIVFSTDATYDTLHSWFRLVDAHAEGNVSTWLNTVLWLVAGLLAGYTARHARDYRKSWTSVAVLGVYFSIDEAVMLHERLNDIFADFGQSLPIATYAWIIPGAIIALGVAGLLLRMVMSLPHVSRNAFLAGGTVFVFGSVGLDGLGGFLFFQDGYNGIFVVLATVEEACEMTGVALCIAAMLCLVERRRMDNAVAYRVTV